MQPYLEGGLCRYNYTKNLKMISSWIITQVGPKSNYSVIQRSRRGHRGEGHTKMEAEIGEVRP